MDEDTKIYYIIKRIEGIEREEIRQLLRQSPEWIEWWRKTFYQDRFSS